MDTISIGLMVEERKMRKAESKSLKQPDMDKENFGGGNQIRTGE